LKSLAAVRETVSDAYPGKEALNKTTMYRLITKFHDAEFFVSDKRSSSDKTTEITVVLFQAVISCSSSILPLVSSFVRGSVRV
jgi:hypothetical protein